MNRQDISRELARRENTTIDLAKDMLNSAIDIISESVHKGETVTLQGFGTFSLRTHKKSKHYDVNSKKLVPIKQYSNMHFHPSKMHRSDKTK